MVNGEDTVEPNARHASEVKVEMGSPGPSCDAALAAVQIRVVAMRALARDVRKTARYIGMLPFVMYAYLRRVRVHIFFVDRTVDVVAEYAPFLRDVCAEGTPQPTAVFCRCMNFEYNGSKHRVVRRLRSDRDVLRGNHWVIGVSLAEHNPSGRIPPHAPCGGEQCGRPGGACMSPLVEDLVCFGMAVLPTAEQGDCGLDVMVYWDGQDRSTASWKTLRLELGAAIDGVAADPHWHGVLDACAELPLPEKDFR